MIKWAWRPKMLKTYILVPSLLVDQTVLLCCGVAIECPLIIQKGKNISCDCPYIGDIACSEVETGNTQNNLPCTAGPHIQIHPRVAELPPPLDTTALLSHEDEH